MKNEERYDTLLKNIEIYGNRGSRYLPRLNDVFYPLHTHDFIRTGFLDICPTIRARDYKDPKWVIVESNCN